MASEDSEELTVTSEVHHFSKEEVIDGSSGGKFALMPSYYSRRIGFFNHQFYYYYIHNVSVFNGCDRCALPQGIKIQ